MFRNRIIYIIIYKVIAAFEILIVMYCSLPP